MATDLDELERLSAKASAAPWVAAKLGPSVWSGALETNERNETRGANRDAFELFELDLFNYSERASSEEEQRRLASRDARLIAAARNALPELIRAARFLATLDKVVASDTATITLYNSDGQAKLLIETQGGQAYKGRGANLLDAFDDCRAEGWEP